MITTTLRYDHLDQKLVYTYYNGRRTVEVIPYVADNGLFFVFEVHAATDPVKGRMLPLCTAQLMAIEILGACLP